MSSRRNFIRSSAISLASPGVYPLLSHTRPHRAAQALPMIDALHMGIAGYTFHRLTVEQSIEIMKQVAISSLSVKDFHIPLDSSHDKIQEVKAKFNAAGITIYAAGVITMKTTADVDQAFQYAQKVGVDLIIATPAYDLLPYVEQKVKTQNIRLAIHNHGPEDKLYPGPKDIYDRISHMDPGVGICLDIGHAVRAGVNPTQAVKAYGSRILDMHIKDVSEGVPGGKAVQVGRGVINFPELVAALLKMKYPGRCSIEFEMDVQDPLAGTAESEGFFRGVMRTLS